MAVGQGLQRGLPRRLRLLPLLLPLMKQALQLAVWELQHLQAPRTCSQGDVSRHTCMLQKPREERCWPQRHPLHRHRHAPRSLPPAFVLVQARPAATPHLETIKEVGPQGEVGGVPRRQVVPHTPPRAVAGRVGHHQAPPQRLGQLGQLQRAAGRGWKAGIVNCKGLQCACHHWNVEAGTGSRPGASRLRASVDAQPLAPPPNPPCALPPQTLLQCPSAAAPPAPA